MEMMVEIKIVSTLLSPGSPGEMTFVQENIHSFVNHVLPLVPAVSMVFPILVDQSSRGTLIAAQTPSVIDRVLLKKFRLLVKIFEFFVNKHIL